MWKHVLTLIILYTGKISATWELVYAAIQNAPFLQARNVKNNLPTYSATQTFT